MRQAFFGALCTGSVAGSKATALLETLHGFHPFGGAHSLTASGGGKACGRGGGSGVGGGARTGGEPTGVVSVTAVGASAATAGRRAGAPGGLLGNVP